MNEISTPVNNAYQNNGPANLINDLAPDEDDQQFSALVRKELKKIAKYPDPAVTQSILNFSRSLKK